MHPTIDLGFKEISLYTALVILGAVIGLVSAFLFLRTYSRRVYSLELFLDAALVTFAAGWIGARAYHVLLSWDYYSTRSDQILSWEAGGLGMRGALIAGSMALAIFARVRRVSFWRLADAAGLGLAIGQALGWVGAFVEGANYGAVNDSAIAMELPNLYGIVEPRVPVQYAEIALFVLLFVGLFGWSLQRPRIGVLFVVYLGAAALGNFALGFFRGDESVYLGGLRVDQVFDAAFVAAALVGWRLLPRAGVGNVG